MNATSKTSLTVSAVSALPKSKITWNLIISVLYPAMAKRATKWIESEIKKQESVDVEKDILLRDALYDMVAKFPLVKNSPEPFRAMLDQLVALYKKETGVVSIKPVKAKKIAKPVVVAPVAKTVASSVRTCEAAVSNKSLTREVILNCLIQQQGEFMAKRGLSVPKVEHKVLARFARVAIKEFRFNLKACKTEKDHIRLNRKAARKLAVGGREFLKARRMITLKAA